MADEILERANKKSVGATIKLDALLTLLFSGVTDQHIKTLQNQSLKHADRKGMLKQKFIEIHGPISDDDFEGFVMSDEFLEFKRKHQSAVDAFTDQIIAK